MRGAQADLDKARKPHTARRRAAYVPVIVSTRAGYGQATGAPLGVPVIFSISHAQSLVFSFSQRDYHSLCSGLHVEAAEHALHEQQIEVVEDTTNTYLALDSAIARKQVYWTQESDVCPAVW